MNRIILLVIGFLMLNLAFLSAQQTWYSLASGDWNDPDIWTLDPAGAVPVNPSSAYPQLATDNVVIKTGKVVVMHAASLTVGTVKVEGSLDLNTTSGHTFDKLRGSGKIFLQGDAYPTITTDDSHFVTLGKGAGTVVFEGNSFSFGASSAYTFCNVEVNMNPGQILTLINDITTNGNLVVRSGTLRVGDNTIRQLHVEGDITVENGTSLTAGGSAVHNINCAGNVTNNGTINLDATGDASFTMTGNSHNSFVCNNITTLYQLVIDKGSDQYYALTLNSSDVSYFNLSGSVSGPDAAKALYLKNGSLKLEGAVSIPELTSGNAFSIANSAQLWLNSSGVSLTISGDSQSLSLSGRLRVSAGQITGNGLNFADGSTSMLYVEGGTVNLSDISTGSGANDSYAYYQSAGTVNINAGDFNMSDDASGFLMKGGSLNLSAGSLLIGALEGNYNVTGGVLTMTGSSSAISSTSNLWDLTIDATNSLSADLIVSNDMTINAGATLDATGDILSIGGNFTNNGTYTSNQTTLFIGSANSLVSGDLTFGHLEIDKDDELNTLSLGTGSVSIGTAGSAGNLTITKGTLDLGSDGINYNVSGDIYIAYGSISGNDALVLNSSSSQQTLQGKVGQNPSFGHLIMNNTNGIGLLSNVDVESFGFSTNGIVDLGAYNMDISTSTYTSGGSWGTSRMFATDGTASNGGLTLPVVLSGTYNDDEVQFYPLGYLDPNDSDAPYFREVYVYADNTTTDIGKITISFNDGNHPTVDDPSGVEDFYWRVDTTLFTSLDDNDLRYVFSQDNSLSTGGSRRGMVFQNDNTWFSGNASLQNSNRDISFDYDTPLQKEYSWGRNNAFNNVKTLYSKASGNFSSATTWTESDTHSGANASPQDYYMYVIGGSGGVNHTVTLGTDDEASQIYIKGKSETGISAGDAPTLEFSSNVEPYDVFGGGNLIYEIKGNGRIITYDAADMPTADFTEFVSSSEAIFEYAGTGSYTLPDYSYYTFFGFIYIPFYQLNEYPNLYLSGSGTKTGANQDILVTQKLYVDDATFNVSTSTNGDIVVFGDVDINTGTLNLPANATRTLDIDGDITFSGTGDFNVTTGGSAREHQVNINGNIIQGDGNIDLSATAYAAVNFIGENSVSVTRTGTGTANFHNIQIDKPLGQKVHFTGDFNLLGDKTGFPKALDLQSGECHIDNTDISIDLTTGGSDFEIPAESILRVSNGTVNTSGINTGIRLDGSLILEGNGIAQLDGGSGTNANYIEYTASGNSYLEASGASQLIVGSQIRRSTLFDEGILDFVQDGGSITIGTHASSGNYASNRGVLELLSAGSSFTQAAGNVISFSNSNGSLSVPSLYFSPETLTLGSGSGFVINTGNTFGIFAEQNLEDISVSGAGTTAQLFNLPISVNGDLSINSGTFDSNDLDVTLNGDLINNGTFTSTNNTCYFSGASAQSISGSGINAFWNAQLSSGNSLALGSDITVNNNFDLLSGTLDTQNSLANIKGNLQNDGTTQTTSGSGVILNGLLDQQEVSGTGVFARLTIDNTNGVVMPTQSASIRIIDQLTLEDGVFDIGRNLMVLESGASFDPGTTYSGDYTTSNMVQTNLSFTDAGIEKYFPVISSSTAFTYPIGSLGKYTPIVFDITENGNGSGSIRVKAADEPHISVPLADQGNVLQYNWTLDADGIAAFSGTAMMYSYDGDAVGDTASYFTGRILLGSLDWNHYSTDDFNGRADDTDVSVFKFGKEVEGSMDGTDDAGIDGDYTAGAALPVSVQAFVTVTDGPWTTTTTWATYDPDTGGIGDPGVGVPAGTGPRGAVVYVNDNLSIPGNFVSAYRTVVNSTGSMSTGSTFGHRLGDVSGAGEIILESGDLPAGVYDEFFGSSGGTLNFSGDKTPGGYDILSEITTVNNLVLSGTGVRNFANLDLQLLGDLSIQGSVGVVNEYDKNISVHGDISFNGGTFDARYGKLIMNGSVLQSISGTENFSSSNALYDFEVNCAVGVQIENDIEVDNVLKLTQGVAYTDAGGSLTIMKSTADAFEGGGNTAYVQGPLRKYITGGDSFTFPLGDATRYGELVLAPDASSTDIWEAQYYNQNPLNNAIRPMDPDDDGTVAFVSHNEYWRAKADDGSGGADLTLRWDNASGVQANNELRIVQWTSADAAWREVSGSGYTVDGNTGTATRTFSLNEFTSEGNYLTFGAITIPSFTWLGTTADWFTTTNWAGGNLPAAGTNISINASSNDPEINTSDVAQVNDLTISSGASLTLLAGAHMTINGDLTTNDDNLVIQNSSTSPSSLITHGAVSDATDNTSGNVKVNWTYEARRYWYIGHSISNPNISSYEQLVTDGNAYVLYDYPAGSWNNITGAGDGFPDPLKGYSLNLRDNTNNTVSHVGLLNTLAVYSTPLTGGWQLVANPYPSYYQLPKQDASGADFEHTTGSVYVRTGSDADNRSLATFNTLNGIATPEDFNGVVAPGQSFWVKKDTDGNVAMRSANRLHDTNRSSLKSTKNGELDVLRISLKNELAIDETVLALRDNGIEDFSRMDSEQRFESANAISYIYSQKSDKNAVINVLPNGRSEYEVILGIKAQEGNHQLSIKGIDGLSQGYNVSIEDKFLGTLTPMTELSTYEFSSVVGSDNDRFVLHLNHVATDIEDGEYDAANKKVSVILRNESILEIECDWEEDSKSVELYSLSGAKLMNEEMKGKKFTKELNLQTGIYLIKVYSKNNSYQTKVFIE